MVTGHYPKSVEEALAIRGEWDDTLLIAGGTDVMVVHKSAEHVIFINQIPELEGIELTSDTLIIGAVVTYQTLLKSEDIPEILKLAIRNIASPAIRSAGTMAGNICNASPAGDTLPILYALDARVVVEGADREVRKIPIEEFILGVRKIKLQSHEMVTAIEIPRASYEGLDKVYYQKVGARESEAISKASFIGAYHLEYGRIKDIRIAFGSIGITVLRLKELEERMRGLTLAELEDIKDEIVALYMEQIHPIDDQRSTAKYRKMVCKNLLTDFLSHK